MPTVTGIELTPQQLAHLQARIRESDSFPNVAAVAEAIGCDRRHLYGILAGRLRPSLSMLESLCQAIGLEVEVATVVKFKAVAATGKTGKNAAAAKTDKTQGRKGETRP